MVKMHDALSQLLWESRLSMVLHKRFLTLTLSLALGLLLATMSRLWAAEANLSWQAPTTNEDGSPLTDLDRYNIYYGPVSRGSQTNPADFQYPSSVPISAGQISYTLTGLTPGQIYYAAVTAMNTSGNESAYSNEITIVAQDSGGGGDSSTPLVAATFDTGAQGFSYADDAFGTSQPSYASGTVSNGALQVLLGGVNNDDIQDISGGWSILFSVSGSSAVSVSFDYTLTQTSEYESNECSEVLVKVNDQLLGRDGPDYVEQMCGNGNGGAAETTGWQTFSTTLSLASGDYVLTLGGYNNQKTLNDEETTILIDNVVVQTD
jgi:hypothetical protein